jgi:hypothetical protein
MVRLGKGARRKEGAYLDGEPEVIGGQTVPEDALYEQAQNLEVNENLEGL